MTKVVSAKLHFETLRRRSTLWDRHHSGIVDQQIEWLAFIQERVSEPSHGLEVRNVEKAYLHLRRWLISCTIVARA